MGAGDLDGDGRADIVWQNKVDGWLAVWTLNGARVLSTQLLSINKQNDQSWTIVGVQDVNGDRKADLVWQRTNGTLATWWMNGAQVTATLLMNPGRVLNANWRIAGPK
jgi:hypothetical protein